MIKKPNNWENVQLYADRPKLPLGAYVCKIKKAVPTSTDYGDQLCILFDICDGEYAGFYADDFAANTREDKKWKGVLRQWLPKEDGTDRDESTKASLKGMITAIENSNPGFHWNWDETTLAGKLVGIVFRNEEWAFKGKTGWTVRPFRATSVDKVVDGTYNLPRDKFLAAPPASAPYPVPNFSQLSEPDEELPF